MMRIFQRKTRVGIFAILIAALILQSLGMILGINNQIVLANGELGTTTPKLILTKNISTIEALPSETIRISIPIRSNVYIENPLASIDTGTGPWEVVSDVVLTRENQSDDVISIGEYAPANVEFDVTVKDTAKVGKYELKLSMSGTVISEGSREYVGDISLDRPIVVKISREKTKPSLTMNNLSVPKKITAGDEFVVNFNLKNEGQLSAKSTTVTVDGLTSDGIIPRYTKSSINLGDIVENNGSKVSLPLMIAAGAETGYRSLTVKVSYSDNDGTGYTLEIPLFLNVIGKEGTSEVEPDLLITDVNQSVSSPLAGGNVTLTFFLENRSNRDVKEIKITPTNLTNANFSPVDSAPYQYIEVLGAGVRKKVTMKLKVSKDVAEGLNEVDINYTYKDDSNKLYGPIAAKLFVLNVSNPEDEGSTPKLIISEFDTSSENLKAGDTFDFNFDVTNTNNRYSAKNIKVTLSSEDNVFSVTKGSNSFYIPAISSGQTVHNTMNLKIKSDSVTKAYPIEIKFEYEYDDMPKATDGTISSGVTVTEVINLQVMENARPVVSNIMFGYGELPTVNTPTSLNFEFYNLGKSVLSNVTAKIESNDFMSSSTMLFIGNVEAGSGDIFEMEVTPMIEGMGTGNLIISYEDSNGDTIEVPTSFETMINPMPVFNPEEDMGMMPDIPMAKEAIINTPLFIVILVVLFLIAIPIGRKATIELYKMKLRKKEENSL